MPNLSFTLQSPCYRSLGLPHCVCSHKTISLSGSLLLNNCFPFTKSSSWHPSLVWESPIKTMAHIGPYVTIISSFFLLILIFCNRFVSVLAIFLSDVENSQTKETWERVCFTLPYLWCYELEMLHAKIGSRIMNTGVQLASFLACSLGSKTKHLVHLRRVFTSQLI